MVIVSSLILFPVYGKWGKFIERDSESIFLTEPRLSGLPWFSLATFRTASPFFFLFYFLDGLDYVPVDLWALSNE